MGAPRVRAEYDELAQIAKMFSKQSETTQTSSKRLSQQVEVLRSGHWVGRGADAFYQEMEGLLPAVRRLVEALAMADRVTKSIIQIMEESDEDASRLIQLFGQGSVAVSIGVSATASAAAAGAGADSWKSVNPLLARDPAGLFTPSKLQGLIGSQFQGVGSELGDAMRGLLSNPSGKKAKSLIAIIIILRGRPGAEIQAEFEKFQEVMDQRDAAQAESPATGGGGGSSDHMGSMTQMRYGSVVGDAFGIDPTFGAMLNPNGGMIGPGNWAFAGADTAVGYHKIAHDAAGYLHNYHGIGPGYDYLGTGSGSPSDPTTGHSAGIAFWRQATGGSTSSSSLRPISQGTPIGGANRLSQSLDRVANIY